MIFQRKRRRVSAAVAWAAAFWISSSASGAPGLLLIAHGSPNPEWNRPVLAFGAKAAAEIEKEGRYQAVRTALMEFAQPNVSAAVVELEAAGCDRIVAVPLFVAPTSHTHFDVPALLGIYASAQTTATLAAEGAAAARPRVPVLLAETLDVDVLCRYAQDQVRKLSRNPRDEAIVLLTHGDPEHHMLVERLMRRVATHCCGTTGITYADWVSIGIGQEYAAKGLPALRAALECKKRAIVVGLYLSTTAATIHRRSTKPRDAKASGGDGTENFTADRVAFSDEPLIAHPALWDWTLNVARRAASR